MIPPPEPPKQLSLAVLVREYILPYNTLFAISGVAAFILGLISPVLVIGFGTLLLSLSLLIVLGNYFFKDALVEWANRKQAPNNVGKSLVRLLWPNADSSLRTSGIFWLIVVMGIAVTLYGSTGVVDRTRQTARGQAAEGVGAAPESTMDRAAARILVLPFSTEASAMEGKDALFASGITDDVSGGLGRFSSLRVMGRTTSTALQASNVEHAVLREKYGVNYILSGTFRISGDKFRLNLELVETGAGTTVWSKRFDGPLAQVVDVDDQVVRSIVGRVASQVMQSDLRQSRNSTPAKLSAYEFTLQARHLWKTPTRETLPQAQSLLRKAIDVEPAYAPAYAYLAFTNLTSYNNSWAEGFSKIETLHNMLASASKAVELEPMNGTAHAAKAIAQTYLGSHSEALAAAREALKFNGSDSDTLGRVGQVLTFLGEHEEAIKVLQLAIDLDPFGPAQFHNFLSRAHFFIRNYEEATTHARICLQRANIEPCRETLAAALSYLHRPEEAVMEWNNITRKRGDVEPEEMVSRLRRAFKRHEDIEHLVLGLKQARESARVAAVPKQ